MLDPRATGHGEEPEGTRRERAVVCRDPGGFMEEAGLEPGLNGELYVNRQRRVGRPIWIKYDYNYKHERAQEEYKCVC